MARFSAIISGAIFALAGVSAAPAQGGRPVFPGSPQPAPANRPQPVQPNQPQPRPAPAVSNATQPPYTPNQPPTAPLKTAAIPPPTTPSAPPEVTYRDGLLAVQAANSTLGSVLSAIRSKTGIEFEGQENMQDRVALSLGPAPAGEVLSSIFAGLKYDFVAIGRPDNPAIVQRVILKARTQPGAATATAQPQPRPAGEGGEDEETPDETPNAEPQDTAVQPATPPQAEPQNQQPKSSEQLLQELKEMNKQQQQQQEGAPPPNPNQVPRKIPPQIR